MTTREPTNPEIKKGKREKSAEVHMADHGGDLGGTSRASGPAGWELPGEIHF